MTDPKALHLPAGYKIRHNNKHWDDRNFGEQWQKHIYLHALHELEKMNGKTVIDIGCGSGFKLVTYFGSYKTIGIEVEPCYSALMARYPDREWFQPNECHTRNTAVLICADVIEHFPDPRILTAQIMEFEPMRIVLSTPQRINNGPPTNKCHCMEWSKDELVSFLTEQFEGYVIKAATVSANKHGRPGARSATLVVASK